MSVNLSTKPNVIVPDYKWTNIPLLPGPQHQNLITTQDNQITEEDQQAATTYYFGIQLVSATAVLGAITAARSTNYKQQTLFNIW